MTYTVKEGERRMATADAISDTGRAALVIASGKGGVGKSVLTVVLGSVLAQQGQRVLMFDGSQNLGNLHVLLGNTSVGNLEQVLHGETNPEDVIQPVGTNLWLLPSDSGTDSLYSLDAVSRARLHYRLSTLYDQFDTVVIDSGPSIEDVVRLCTMRASGLIVVTVAEPTALTDAYALIKIVTTKVPGLSVSVLANHVQSEAEGHAAFDRLSVACQRFLRFELGYLGSVPEDPTIQSTVRHPDRFRHWESRGAAADALQHIVANQHGMFGLPADRA